MSGKVEPDAAGSKKAGPEQTVELGLFFAAIVNNQEPLVCILPIPNTDKR